MTGARTVGMSGGPGSLLGVWLSELDGAGGVLGIPRGVDLACFVFGLKPPRRSKEGT